jgi:hypothetical protein
MKRSLATLIVLAATTTGALACPMCKDSVSNREGETNELHDSYTTGGQNIASGLNASVYVMLGTLFGMMGLVSTVIVKGVRSSGATRGLPIERSDDQAKR